MSQKKEKRFNLIKADFRSFFGDFHECFILKVFSNFS